jgi:hypothetical protein
VDSIVAYFGTPIKPGLNGFRRPRRPDGSLSRAARRHISSQLWMTPLLAFFSRKATSKADIHTLRARGFSGAPLERHQRGELSQEEAAEMLGVSERTFRRWATGCTMRGRRGLRIGGSASHRAVGRRPRRSCARLELYEGALPRLPGEALS